MRRTTAILAATAAATLVLPAAASAGSYQVEVCRTQAQNDVPGANGGWSTVVGGSSIAANAAPVGWVDVCSRYRNNVGNWAGVGGAFGDTTAAGSYAFAKFVPPAGSSITAVQSWQDLVVTNGSYAEAGIFAANGAAFTDNSYFLAGGGESSRGPFGFGNAGADGAQGLLLGARCPSTLPPAAGGYCGGAGASYYDLQITVEDPSNPTLTASLELDGAGKANLAWSGSDPQSGIASTSVTRAGNTPATQQLACNATVAPPCPTSTGGTSSMQLAEGETATFTVSVSTKWGGTATKTMSVARPRTSVPPPTTPTTPPPTTPPPTSPPPTTPPPAAAKITLKTKAVKGRRLALSGSARGCKRVTIKVPGTKRTKTAKVKRAKWSLTVPRKRGTYRATCGAAAANRSVR